VIGSGLVGLLEVVLQVRSGSGEAIARLDVVREPL